MFVENTGIFYAFAPFSFRTRSLYPLPRNSLHIHPGLLAPSTVDLTGGYVSDGQWKMPTVSVCYTDVYAVEADKPYFIALGAIVGTRFRAMFSTGNTATATENIAGTQVNNAKNPAPYAFVTYTPTENGYITVTKDDAGTENIKTYVFDIQALIEGISLTNGGGQAGGE